jgi:hypothetical protein
MSFSTRTLAYRLDSLVRVSRRDGKNHFDKITIVPQANCTLHGRAFFDTFDLILSVALVETTQCKPWYSSARPSVFSASFSTISDLFTLFSKSFSSFLHSTCLLSVSHPYLALEDSYLPLRAAVPSNPTLVGATCFKRKLYGTFTLYGTRFDMFKLSFVFRWTWLQFEDSLNHRFQFWAFTGSVALTKVIFVNFFSSA